MTEQQLNDCITDDTDDCAGMYDQTEEVTLDDEVANLRQAIAQEHGDHESGSLAHAVLNVADAVLLAAAMLRQGLGWVSTSIDDMVKAKNEALELDDDEDPDGAEDEDD